MYPFCWGSSSIQFLWISFQQRCTSPRSLLSMLPSRLPVPGLPIEAGCLEVHWGADLERNEGRLGEGLHNYTDILYSQFWSNLHHSWNNSTFFQYSFTQCLKKTLSCSETKLNELLVKFQLTGEHTWHKISFGITSSPNWNEDSTSYCPRQSQRKSCGSRQFKLCYRLVRAVKQNFLQVFCSMKIVEISHFATLLLTGMHLFINTTH